MPYLFTMEEENQEYLPEAFLYLLTGQDEYKNTLLLRQQAGKYWETTGDKFYDSAVALYPITDAIEKTNTQNWLLEIQEKDGCFPTTIRNNAFLLASIWPRQVDPSKTECTAAGFFCVPSISCETIDVKSGYTCAGGVSDCCATKPELKSCSEQLGTICSPDENCVGGTTIDSSDISLGELCCIGGTCEVPKPKSECENNFGRCAISCSSGEIEADYDCDAIGDVCCVTGEEKGSLWWIWLLIILIILVVLGIIFRKKLRSIFKKGPASFPPKIGPGPRPGMPPTRPLQRRILPPQARRPVSKPAKKLDELSDVLSKLKQMSK